MSLACVSTTLDHDVDAVWAVVGDFHGLPAWIGRIRSGEAEGGSGRGPVGSVRRLTLEPEGRVARERLVRYDEPGRSYSYEFADAIPFPVGAYRGNVRVLPITDSGATFIEWYGEFDCDAAILEEITAIFKAIYTEFLEDLRAHLKR
jgi:hypothetical protein